MGRTFKELNKGFENLLRCGSCYQKVDFLIKDNCLKCAGYTYNGR